MKLQHLRSLVVVHECGSLQQATKRLHISQPALSRTLQALEGELGVALLIRSSQGITLTSYGLRLIEHARHVLGSVERARRDIGEMRGSATRRISIGITAVAALSVTLEGVMVEFHAKCPDTQLCIHELRPSEINAMLREGSLDLALTTHLPEASSGLDVLTVHHIPMRIAARQGHPLLKEKKLSHLLDAIWLTSASGPTSFFEQFFERNGLPPPQRVLECSSLIVALDAMTGLDALMMGPQMNARLSQAFHEQIQPLHIESDLPDLPVLMICSNRSLLPSSADLVFELIQSSLQGGHPTTGG